jgi:hypothetical protein
MYKVVMRERETNKVEVVNVEAESTFDAHQKAKEIISERFGSAENWFVRTSSKLKPHESASKH